MPKIKFKVGDTVKIKDCSYAKERGIVNCFGKVIKAGNTTSGEYRVQIYDYIAKKFTKTAYNLYTEELELASLEPKISGMTKFFKSFS